MVAVRLLVCLAVIAPVFSEVYHSMSNAMYNYAQPSYLGGYYGMNDYDSYDYSRDNYMDAMQNQYQMNMLNGLGNGYDLMGYNSYPMQQQYTQQYQQQYQGMNRVGQTNAGNAVQNVPMSQMATATTHGANDHASTVADIIRSILTGHSNQQSNAVRKYVVI